SGTTINADGLQSSRAEFDALGGSVGLENPYPDMNQQPQGEGCIGCGSNGIIGIDDNSPLMVNGARMDFAIDGMRVNHSRFINHLNLQFATRGYGSAEFGLMQYAAYKSLQITGTGSYILENDGTISNISGGFDVWEVNSWSFIGFNNKYPKRLHDVKYSKYPDPLKNLKPRVDKVLSDKTCKEKINELLKKLGSSSNIDTITEQIYSEKGSIVLSLTDEAVELYKPNKNRDPVKAPAGETSQITPTLLSKERSSVLLNRKFYGESYEVLTFLHEIFHATDKSGNNHINIAEKIAEIEGIDTKFGEYIKGQNWRDDASSSLINSWLDKYCFKGEMEGVQKWEVILKKIGVQ
ncbi:MAG TPA: hypothetical protein PKE69_15840, partial [Pyrinomonadaceae bacterium]|nr:hypothetical protein [Pyrinomonadaceae bacterium]